MNVGDEHSVSLWMKDGPAIEAPALSRDEEADVVVIGAGIAGLSTAYELSRLGKSVMVIDRGKIGCGMEHRSHPFARQLSQPPAVSPNSPIRLSSAGS